MIDPKLGALKPQARIFVLEYMKDFKVGKASERSGISPSTGSAWLSDPEVQDALAEQMERRIMQTQIDDDWVLQQLAQMFEADLADIFYPGTNDLRPIHEWPEIWRKMATSIKVDNKSHRVDGESVEYTVKDVKILDRLKALGMIGDHTKVQAFKQNIEMNLTERDLTNKLAAGRKRASQRNRKQEEPTMESFL